MFVFRVGLAMRSFLATIVGIIACVPGEEERQEDAGQNEMESTPAVQSDDSQDGDTGGTEVNSKVEESGSSSVSGDVATESSGETGEATTQESESSADSGTGDGDQNFAPVAHAGFAQLAHGGRASLNADLSKDGNGDALSFRWYQISGPHQVHFSVQNQVSTEVTQLDAAGHYVFGVEVSDGQYTDTSQVMVVSRGAPSSTVEFVFHISVDGFRPDVLSAVGPIRTPNFHRLIAEGATTLNARADMDQTVTLPNHTSQLTGRMVGGPKGHGWITNSFGGSTLHEVKGSYVASVFDVVHNAGYRTAMFVGKAKFAMFPTSFGPETGADDISGEDNGRGKIDVYREVYDIGELVDALKETMATLPSEYTFFHFSEPDLTGHSYSWSLRLDSEYVASVENVDRELGRILAMIDSSEIFSGHSVIILTADHGGFEWGHTESALWQNFTIPFFVWGKGVARGKELYSLNPLTRRDPGQSKADDLTALRQPIRHAEAANLACYFFGLPFIPGSTVNLWDSRLSVQ